MSESGDRVDAVRYNLVAAGNRGGKIRLTDEQIESFRVMFENDIRRAISNALTRMLERDLRLCWSHGGNLMAQMTMRARWGRPKGVLKE